MASKEEHLLNVALQENQLSLPSAATEKLLAFLDLLKKWNAVYNLTAILEPREMIYLHLIDSLKMQPFLIGHRMLDVGSGGGLPGLPLAIQNPQQEWVLLDKNSKKTRFLIQAIAELGLSNVKAVHSRCEDFHPDACFDSILSRAFGTIAMFVENTEHLICPHGKFIAMKGKYPQEELQDLPARFQIESARVHIKGVSIERHVISLMQNS